MYVHMYACVCVKPSNSRGAKGYAYCISDIGNVHEKNMCHLVLSYSACIQCH